MTATTETSAADPADRAPNPFKIPDLGRRSRRPLWPWKHPHHAALYLPVDNTQEAFDAFRDYLPDPLHELGATGRLVVAAGDKGCGKTSLIHRCVHYITESVTDSAHPVVVIDVTNPPALSVNENLSPDPNNPVNDQLDRLAHLALTKLAGLIADFRAPEVPPPAHSAYAQIALAMRERGGLAIILLPPFKDAVASPPPDSSSAVQNHPVQHYLGLRDERLIFFAESLNAPGLRQWHRELSGEHSEDTLILEVGPLQADDGWIFANGRVKGCEHALVPEISSATIKDLFQQQRKMSLSELQEMCFDLWAQAVERSGVIEVSSEDIKNYFEVRARGYAPRPRGPRDGVR